jgi:hypothetical protein
MSARPPLPSAAVHQARQNLRDHGWTVYEPMFHDLYGCAGPPCDPTTIPLGTTFVARRGDTTLTMDMNPSYPGNLGAISGSSAWPPCPAVSR